MSELFPVVVVGGGLAGLTAALHLAARDILPLVLEADTEWPGGCLAGGAADRFDYQKRTWQFHSQHGIHAVWGGYYNMEATLHRFLKVQLRASEGEDWISRWGNTVRHMEAGTVVRNTWFPAPFHYLQFFLRTRFWSNITLLDFLSMPGFFNSTIWATGFDPILEQTPLNGIMMNEFFRGWTPNLKATFVSLANSLLASPSEKITLTAFIAAMRFFTMLRRDTWHLKYFPGNSHDCIIQPMIDKITELGGRVQMGARVASLKHAGKSWIVRFEDARLGGMRTLEAEHVILAVDPPAAERILHASADTAEVAKPMIFPENLLNGTVRLWFDAAPKSGSPGGMFTGDFQIDNFFWLHRIHEDFFEWHRVTGGSVIEVHLYTPDAVFEQPDEMLVIMATNEVLRAFPELRGHFVHGILRRNGRNQTRFLVPGEHSLHVETPWPGILACGDWIGYPSPTMWMERCCVTGIAAANHVIQAHGGEAFDIIPPPKPEWLARLMGGFIHLIRRVFGSAIVWLARKLPMIDYPFVGTK